MTVTHRSLSVAVESTFGSISSTTGLPDNSGLTYISIPCERDPIIIPGEPVASERNDARDGSYFVPPEPDTVYSSGSRIRRRTGQVVCRVDLTTIGSGADTYASNYLGHLLGGGLKTQLPSIVDGDAVTAIASVNKFTPTTGYAVADVGCLISAELSGRAEYSAITDNDVSGDVTVSPAFSAGFTGTPTVYPMATWYVPSRSNTGTKEHSLSFKVDGVNFRSYAYGCVLESLSITLDNGRLMGEFTYQAALIQDDHSSASGPVEPAYNDGAPPFFRGSYVVISNGSPASLSDGTVGETQGRVALSCEDFSLTLTNTLTPLGHSNDILAMSGMDITDVSVELSLTLSSPSSTVADDYFNRTVRQVLVGTGPTGDGKGCALMLPAAMLTNDPSAYDVTGNDIVRQTLTYQQSRYSGDFTTAAYEANAGNSPFRLGLGV
ncbi:MAG: hypothetical protein Unbinned2299contig1001_25 [Prokaryotic dsDNA virus sp.]|nr:MAG: hypothetical protein Unbinned2299contig1001_25 [Prokaryotic dsDNA virus sp.]